MNTLKFTVFGGLALSCTLLVGQVSATTIQWSGMTWDVKNGNGLGPGPNNWSDSTDSVWVDSNDNLHLKVRRHRGKWLSAEVTSQDSLGFGDYEFRVETNTENYDKNVVAGLFTYASDTEEVDIELTKFGDANNTNAHYTVQPYFNSGNTTGFDLGLNGDFSTHSFDWTANSIDFESLHGHNSTPPTPGHVINQWTYTGADIPSEGAEKVHINLWLFQGNKPTNNQSHELVIDSFTFTPAGGAAALSIPEPAALTLMGLGGIAMLKRRGV